MENKNEIKKEVELLATQQGSATGFRFMPPALQVDFPDNPVKQQLLIEQWNINLKGFTEQGITGNPWNSSNSSDITNYFNPLTTAIPGSAVNVSIEWNAYPGRILHYYPNLSTNDQNAIADTGLLANGNIPTQITSNPCDATDTDTIPYGPYGPRGFQDEYCEWSVQRNAAGKITRIDFTCENPEYWNSLWIVDPNQVLAIYQKTLDYADIKIEDLYLTDADGNYVTDPSTGTYAYNPLNKWNNGMGGAMHLTSTPNTIQTEIGLGSQASILRTTGNTDSQALLCCGQFGQKFRNSDPFIGQMVNRYVSSGLEVTLANPPGLYIQMPDDTAFSSLTTPDNTPASSFWTILRGQESLPDQDGLSMPNNFILHAKFEVPADLGYTISDITYDSGDDNPVPITWGSQISRLFKMQIVATGFKSSNTPAVCPCVGTPKTVYAQPLQLFHENIFNAMNAVNVKNAEGFPMTLLSNSTFIAPKVVGGRSDINMVLTADSLDLTQGLTTVTFDGDDLTATVVSTGTVNYAVPGNSYPGTYSTINLKLDVKPTARLGLRDVYVTNAGQEQSTAMPALLYVLPDLEVLN